MALSVLVYSPQPLAIAGLLCPIQSSISTSLSSIACFLFSRINIKGLFWIFIIQPKTPSLQWNNCLCIYWPCAQCSVAFFACIAMFGYWVIWSFQLPVNCYSEQNVFCPNWPCKVSWRYSFLWWSDVRQPYLYWDSEGVFANLCYLLCCRKKHAVVICLVSFGYVNIANTSMWIFSTLFAGLLWER